MAMTIGDIAKLAGVSRATVSGVLNNSPTVSAKTKERVLAIIEEHNYRPNEIARALALNQTALIGLIVKDISNPLYSIISLGVEEVCEENGYSVILGNTHKQWNREVAHIRLLTRRRVDGLIIFPLQKETDLAHIQELKDSDYPFVLLAEVPGVEADLVRADDETGAFDATTHLISLGRKNLVYITGPETALASDRRLRGFQRGLETRDIPFDNNSVRTGGWRLQDGYRAGIELLCGSEKVADGAFCYNDAVAIGFIRALIEKGCRVPEDVAVVGFDDAGAGAFLETSLTAVAQPAREIGRKAAEVLLNRIRRKNKIPLQKLFLDTHLVVRETCGAQKKGCVNALN